MFFFFFAEFSNPKLEKGGRAISVRNTPKMGRMKVGNNISRGSTSKLR